MESMVEGMNRRVGVVGQINSQDAEAVPPPNTPLSKMKYETLDPR